MKHEALSEAQRLKSWTRKSLITMMRPKDNQKLSQRQTRDETGESCIDQEVRSRDTSYLDEGFRYYSIQG